MKSRLRWPFRSWRRRSTCLQAPMLTVSELRHAYWVEITPELKDRIWQRLQRRIEELEQQPRPRR